MIRFESLPPEVTEAMCTPMHLILPFPDSSSSSSSSATRGALYVGGLVAAMDNDLLKQHHITHLVQVMDAAWPADSLRDNSLRLDVHRIDILDNISADIRQHLDGACTYIETTLRNGRNVLVHCQQGVSRSPSIVIAYLIRHHNMSFEDARALVKKRRPCINPNPGFVATLKLWEEFWRYGNNDRDRPLAFRRTTA